MVSYFNGMSESNVLNSIGLIIDIIGAIGLFICRDKGLKNLSNFPKIRITSTMSHSKVDDLIYSEIKDLKNEINTIIQQTNKINQRVAKESVIWFILIFAGFGVQLVANIFCH